MERLAGRRLVALGVVGVVLCAGLAARVVQLQVVSADRYRRLGADQRVDRIALPAGRGTVLDRRGRALAVSADAPSVFADPRLVEDPVVDAARLSPVLHVPEDLLRVRLGKKAAFVWLRRKVDEPTAVAVRKLRVKGVSVTTEPLRRYPSGTLAASILGFVDVDNNGLGGIEAHEDRVLRGVAGELVSERDPAGRSIPSGRYRHRRTTPGRDVHLTVDTAIQYEAEAALENAMEKYSAKGGIVAVMDPRTGDVLALANRPTFDPNDAGASPPEARGSWGVGNVFEPGSTSKVVAVSAALEQGVVTPETTFTVPDRVRVWDRVFSDSESHDDASWSVAEIMAESSNVGVIRIAARLGSRRFEEYLRRFGYGRETGIELPGESAGIYQPKERWTGTTLPSVAIGHGVAVTSLQMLRVFGAVANGGEMHEPRLIRSTSGPGGDVPAKRPPPRRPITAHTAETMTRLLAGVVSHGTGVQAAVPGYTVAGKTGTARKLVGGAYSKTKYVSSFVGFAPAEDPRVVVLVVLDEPTPIYGGQTAAPTFSRVTAFALRHLRVRPSPAPQEITAPKPLRKTGRGSVFRAWGALKPPPPRRDRSGPVAVAPGEDPAAASAGTPGGTPGRKEVPATITGSPGG